MMEKFNSQEIVNILLTLNQMGLKWKDLSSFLQYSLLSSVERNMQHFNSQKIANTLLVLDQMGLKWKDLPDKLQEGLLCSVEQNTKRFNSQEIVNILLALNQMGLEWKDLPGKLQEGLLRSVEQNMRRFNSQDIANTLLALSRFQVFDSSCLNALLQRAHAVFCDFCMIEIQQIFQALTWLQAYGHIIPVHFSEYNVDLDLSESRLQRAVLSCVRSVYEQAQWISEYRIGFGGCIAVDIFSPELNIIIEVNGPTHYDSEGRLDFASLQKQKLLEKLGHRVVHIDHRDWDQLNGDASRKCFLEKALGVVKIGDQGFFGSTSDDSRVRAALNSGG